MKIQYETYSKNKFKNINKVINKLKETKKNQC